MLVDVAGRAEAAPKGAGQVYGSGNPAAATDEV